MKEKRARGLLAAMRRLRLNDHQLENRSPPGVEEVRGLLPEKFRSASKDSSIQHAMLELLRIKHGAPQRNGRKPHSSDKPPPSTLQITKDLMTGEVILGHSTSSSQALYLSPADVERLRKALAV